MPVGRPRLEVWFPSKRVGADAGVVHKVEEGQPDSRERQALREREGGRRLSGRPGRVARVRDDWRAHAREGPECGGRQEGVPGGARPSVAWSGRRAPAGSSARSDRSGADHAATFDVFRVDWLHFTGDARVANET